MVDVTKHKRSDAMKVVKMEISIKLVTQLTLLENKFYTKKKEINGD